MLIEWIVGCCGSAAPDVIDLGCGTGELTRRLAPRTRSVVAIDASPPVAGYITSIHSRNGFSRDCMTDERAAAFDDATRRLVAPHTQNGTVTLTIETRAGESEVKLVSW